MVVMITVCGGVRGGGDDHSVGGGVSCGGDDHSVRGGVSGCADTPSQFVLHVDCEITSCFTQW